MLISNWHNLNMRIKKEEYVVIIISSLKGTNDLDISSV